jgi:papilin
LPEPIRSDCHNYTLHWRYDDKAGRCVQFWYGGCNANQNQFNTEKECINKCIEPEGTAVCKLDLVNPTGMCSLNETRFYYDTIESKCVEFKYSGCFGNGNNFKNLEECERRCQVKLLFEQCSAIPRRGPCRGDHQRWYYDSKLGKCETFSYGGCVKRKNNHLSENECFQSCVKPKQNGFYF